MGKWKASDFEDTNTKTNMSLSKQGKWSASDFEDNSDLDKKQKLNNYQKSALQQQKDQKLKELNAKPTYEQEASAAIQKVDNRPWYLPKSIAIPIEGAKLSPEARMIFAEKNSADQVNTAGAVAANKFIDSNTSGLYSTLDKKQAEKFGTKGQELLKLKSEAEKNHPVAATIGTIAGYVAPGAAAEKVAGKALAPVIGKVGSKVAQKAITGAATGGGMELVEGAIRGDSPEELANRVAAGVGLGAAGDVAVYAIGSKLGKSLLKNYKVPKELEIEIKRTDGAFSIDSNGNVYRDGKFLKKLNKGGGGDIIKSESNKFVDQYGNVRGSAETNLQIPEIKRTSSQKIEPLLQPKFKVQEQYKKEFPSRLTPGELYKTTVADQKHSTDSILTYKPEKNIKTDLPKLLNNVVMDTPKSKLNFKQSMSGLRTKLVDKNLPITRFSNVANDRTGMLASNTNNANGTIDYILQDALVDRQGKKIGSSLKEVADQIPKGKEGDFWEYMSQRHNIDRAREGKNVISNYTPEMSTEAVKQIEAAHPTWKATGDQITNWIDNFMREWGVNSGTVDSDVYNQLRNTYKSYFPTQREFSQLEKSIPGDMRKQFVDSASPIGKAKGSDRDIHNPLSNIMNLVNRTVKTARYNEVGQSLLDSVRKQPEKLRPLAEVIEPKDGMFSNVDNIVAVLENGKPVYLQINDKALLDSLKGLPKMVNNAQVMRKISNVYKGLITQKNPLFAVRNMARDIPTAYIYGSESNPVKFTGDLLKAGKDVLTGSENLQRYKALGGGGSNFLAGDADKAAKNLLKKPNLLQRAGSSIEAFNNITEAAPRLAEFNRVLEKTGDVQKAIAASNDVTVNFARGGNVSKSIEPVVPYFNASVQGLDKFFRQVKHNPVQTLVKSGIAITAPEVALYLINKDNPDYQALDNRTKDTYFLIPKGDGTFIKIPKSRELGVLFGSLFTRLARASEGDEKAFKGYGNALATGFAPTNPIENNFFSPLLLNRPINKDFAGRAIVPMNMINDQRSAYLQYDERTTEIAKAIGKAVADTTGGEGWSPKQIDYIIKSYTGVIGQLGIPAATKGGSPSKAITSQFIADPLYSNQTIQDFYDNYKDVQKKAADKNILNKLPSKLITPEEKTEGKFRKASNKISELNKQIRESNGDEATIRELRKQIVVIAKEANDLLK